jgi:hypothetical protein
MRKRKRLEARLYLKAINFNHLKINYRKILEGWEKYLALGIKITTKEGEIKSKRLKQKRLLIAELYRSYLK